MHYFDRKVKRKYWLLIFATNLLYLIIILCIKFCCAWLRLWHKLHSILCPILVLWLLTELSNSPLFPLIFSDETSYHNPEGKGTNSSFWDCAPRHMAIWLGLFHLFLRWPLVAAEPVISLWIDGLSPDYAIFLL